MEIMSEAILKEKIKYLAEYILPTAFDPMVELQSADNLEDLKSLLVEHGEENFLSHYDDLLLFMETGFSLENLDESSFIAVYDYIKEIEINLTILKLKNTYNNFKPHDTFHKSNIKDLDVGDILFTEEEIYLVKRKSKKTTKGYEIVVELLFSRELQYSNNIYIDVIPECFYIIGKFLE